VKRFEMLSVEQLLSVFRAMESAKLGDRYPELVRDLGAELARRNVDWVELTAPEVLAAVQDFVRRGQAAQQGVDALCAQDRPMCSCGHALSEHYPVHRVYHVCTDPDCECGSFEGHA
jgi:predicted DNA-binding helix-hairpin-helix protein